MVDPVSCHEDGSLERVLYLVEQAMELCDAKGYILVVVDLSAAADKLRALQPDKLGGQAEERG